MDHEKEKAEDSRGRVLFHAKRLSVNALLQIGSQVLPLLAGAVSIPLLYHNIGRDEFGVFSIGLSALGMFALLDLGLGRAAVRFMARAFADKDLPLAASIAAHSALILGLFSLLLTAGCLAAIPFAAVHWVHSESKDQGLLTQCLYILVFALPLVSLTSVFRAVLEAKESFFVISVIQGLLGVSTYIVPLIVSFETRDVRLIIGGAVICRGLAFGVFLAAGLRAWGGPFPWHALDLRAQKEFRRFSVWMVVSNVVGSSIHYGDRALLVKMFGLAEIPFYNVPVELLGRVMIIVNAAATVVFPALSRASEKKLLFEDVYVTITTFLGVMVGMALLCLSLLTPLGLHLWLGDEFRAHSTHIVRILLVGLVFQTLNIFALASLNARGFARPITFMHVLESPVYLWALYHFGTTYGMIGVATVWSLRLIVEYVCFAAFQAHLGTKEGAGRRIIGALVVSGNAAPLVALATNRSETLVVGAAASCMAISLVWGYSLMKSGWARQARQ